MLREADGRREGRRTRFAGAHAAQDATPEIVSDPCRMRTTVSGTPPVPAHADILPPADIMNPS